MVLRNDCPIGVFDSGVGGLTVLKQLQKVLPNEKFIYLGDTKNNPYGPRTEREICELSNNIVEYLEQIPVKMAVIACNTITVVASDYLRGKVNIPIVGNSYGVKSALNACKNNCIGIMATEATINTHKHKNAIIEANPAIHVVEEACPTLAGDIEEGIIHHPELKETVSKHLENLISKGVDTIVLGCTHYPFIENILLEIVAENYPSSKISFIDPGMETALNTKLELENQGLLANGKEESTVEVLFTKVLDTTQEAVNAAVANEKSNVKEVLI